jgi:hypothetical protein
MNERVIPAPSVDAESAAFYAAAKQGRFLIRRCRACGRAHWHPRSLCPFCFGETEWSEASGEGEIYSYSVPVWRWPRLRCGYGRQRLPSGPQGDSQSPRSHRYDCCWPSPSSRARGLARTSNSIATLIPKA